MRKTILFKEWAEIWLKTVKGTVRGNTYAVTYKNTVYNHLIPCFGERELQTIKQTDIQLYLNDKAVFFCLDTLKKNKSCLKQMFEAAIDNEYLDKNPVRNIKMPRARTAEEKAIYTEEQINYIFQYGNFHRFGYEIQLLIDTGLSRSELLGLKWGDVDFDTKVLYIRRGVTDTPDPTTGKITVTVDVPKNKFRERVIPLRQEMCKILQSQKEQRKATTENYIVKTRNGQICSPRTWSRRHYQIFMEDMRNYYSEKGIEIPIYTPHQFRHTRASLWVNSDMSLYAIAKVMGHADLDMLRKRYAHSDADQLRRLLNIK
ncbi:MAG: site-specific integrase [Ruminiclostridium sp.]|nr:site-specific integrase [Ruminiclostridium sp.]